MTNDTFVEHDSIFKDLIDRASSSSDNLNNNKKHYNTIWATQEQDDAAKMGILVFNPTQLSPSIYRQGEDMLTTNQVIDPTSVYASLPRLKSLPSRCKYHIQDNDKLQEATSKIWEGDFIALCYFDPFQDRVVSPLTQILQTSLPTQTEIDANEYINENQNRLMLRIPLLGLGEESPLIERPALEIKIVLKLKQKTPNLSAAFNGNNGGVFSPFFLDWMQPGDVDISYALCNCTTTQLMSYWSSWTKKHQQSIVARILHHLIRQHGHNFPWLVLNSVERVVSAKYGKLTAKGLEDHLDLRIVCLDQVLHHHSTMEDFAWHIHFYFERISELLQGLSRFEQAADLRMELAQVYTPKVCMFEFVHSYAQIRSFKIASRTFMLAGKFERVEECLVKALHVSSKHHGTSWDINDPLLKEIFALWGHLNGEKGVKNQGDLLFTYAFWSLVFLAGLNINDDDGGLMGWKLISDTACTRVIKTFFQTPDRAKAALQYALKTGTVKDFKERVLKVVDKDAKARITKVYDTKTKSEFKIPRSNKKQEIAETLLDHEKEMAKTLLRADKSNASWLQSCKNVHCNAVETKPKTFLQCPCRSVCYCSKNCQKGDWKNHKKDCSHHAAEKISQSK